MSDGEVWIQVTITHSGTSGSTWTRKKKGEKRSPRVESHQNLARKAILQISAGREIQKQTEENIAPWHSLVADGLLIHIKQHDSCTESKVRTWKPTCDLKSQRRSHTPHPRNHRWRDLLNTTFKWRCVKNHGTNFPQDPRIQESSHTCFKMKYYPRRLFEVMCKLKKKGLTWKKGHHDLTFKGF